MESPVLQTTVACLQKFLSPKEISVDKETLLFDRGGVLDSISLVAFLLELEQQLSENHAMSVRLISDKALSQKQSPFRSVGSLTDYIGEISS
jgi:acyl carrier protein